MKVLDKAKAFVQGVKNTVKKILNAIKFFATPIGTVVGWALLIVFALLLFAALTAVGITAIKDFFGFDINYSTYEDDLKVIQELEDSGYSRLINSENFQNFKAFEYAVLIDTAEYIRNSGQDDFDLVDNQGIYEYERQQLIERVYDGDPKKFYQETMTPEEFAKYNNKTPSAVTLLSTSSDYNQANISDSELATALNAASQGLHGVDVRGDNIAGNNSSFTNSSKTTKGGNNRVSDPFLVYEFVYSGQYSGEMLEEMNAIANSANSDDENVGENVEDNVSNTKDKNKEGEGTAQQLEASGEVGGSVEPFIYIVKEKVDFSFYFNGSQAIEIPFILNVNNAELMTSSERSKEINRALRGVAPVVYPDENYTKSGPYTFTPYYSDKTNCTIYKIPLRTLIGRYMPRAELLQVWAVLKQGVEPSNINVEQVTKYIKNIYNEACLNGEEITNESSGGDTYSKASTHQESFLDFQKVGAELTLCSQKFSTKSDDEEMSGEFDSTKYVKDFISAYYVDEASEITVDYTYNCTYRYANTTEVIPNTGDEESTTPISTTTIEGGSNSGTVKHDTDSKWTLEKCLANTGFQKAEYLVAYESGVAEGAYSPPADLNTLTEGWYHRGKISVDALMKLIKENLAKTIEETKKDDWEKQRASILGVSELESFDVEVTVDNINGLELEYSPIFIIGEIKPTQKLEVEHTRMPMLLVKSATTWAREINYSHSISQNMFEFTNKKYLIPNSVTSMGLTKMTTTETKSEYRGKAYNEIFTRMKEKDVVAMLMQLEDAGNNGSTDCFEYMRDLYKLVHATQSGEGSTINPDTYAYVYIPDSILYYDDSQTQKIYWTNMLAARGSRADELTKEEVENVKTRNQEITWQVVDYANYDECQGKVYALNPFGSAYVRANFELKYNGEMQDVAGNYGNGGHGGCDWSGRSMIDNIMQDGKSAVDIDSNASKIYQYELKNLKDVYGNKAEQILQKNLSEEVAYMPVVAVAPGKVKTAGFDARSGFYVVISHTEDDSVQTKYMHLKRWPSVNKGDYVGAGTLLGYEGETGRAWGSHLHFEMVKSGVINGSSHSNGVGPYSFIFPSFNPFYNAEKAKEAGNDLTSEYMSLYRTVYLPGDPNRTDDNANMVPSLALVDSIDALVQNQGDMDKSISMKGSLGWAGKEYDDIYLEPALFDLQQASSAGYLNVDSELYAILYGYIPVKTDMAGALPALTREELVYILEHWLSNRYSADEYEWLMKNVFTDDTINKIIEAQNKYNVSAVFALAVGTLEQQLGISYYRDNTKILGKPGNNNIFSIKGTRNGGVSYQGGKMWNVYSSYGDAFEGFFSLIAGKNYFGSNRYTIAEIGKVYCEGDTWAGSVTSVALEIMQYYSGTKWSFPSGFSFDNSDLVAAMENCMRFLNENKSHFTYGYGVRIPPYKESGGVWTVSSANQIDCSGYVSWVITEYGKGIGNEDLANFGRWSSSTFESLYNRLKRNSTSGIDKYFEIVLTREDIARLGGWSSKAVNDVMKAGDIILYREGSGHHVEMLAEDGKKNVYTCGSASGWYNPGAQRYTRRSDYTAVLRLKTGAQ